MQFSCRVEKQANGQWCAKASGSRVGDVVVRADSRHEALAKLRAELRYRVELCPCSGVSEEYVELQIQEQGPR